VANMKFYLPTLINFTVPASYYIYLYIFYILFYIPLILGQLNFCNSGPNQDRNLIFVPS